MLRRMGNFFFVVFLFEMVLHKQREISIVADICFGNFGLGPHREKMIKCCVVLGNDRETQKESLIFFMISKVRSDEQRNSSLKTFHV